MNKLLVARRLGGSPRGLQRIRPFIPLLVLHWASKLRQVGIRPRGLPVIVRVLLRGVVHLEGVVSGLKTAIFSATGLLAWGLVTTITLHVAYGAWTSPACPPPVTRCCRGWLKPNRGHE